jgi:hypothetical protein
VLLAKCGVQVLVDSKHQSPEGHSRLNHRASSSIFPDPQRNVPLRPRAEHFREIQRQVSAHEAHFTRVDISSRSACLEAPSRFPSTTSFRRCQR